MLSYIHIEFIVLLIAFVRMFFLHIIPTNNVFLILLSFFSLYRIFSAIISSWLTSISEPEATISTLVQATIKVYSTITTELLPTPTKSHYTFNLRDLSKVFQGMLMVPSSKVKVC